MKQLRTATGTFQLHRIDGAELAAFILSSVSSDQLRAGLRDLLGNDTGQVQQEIISGIRVTTRSSNRNPISR